jgi:hypothetical protein
MLKVRRGCSTERKAQKQVLQPI